jgi:hypothetical protein
MRRPSPAMLVALLSLFVAMGGVGVAATGGNFILGQSNSASSKSTLTAGINDKALVVTNNNAGSNATALGLNVASGRPPMIISSSAGKATNLNADKLDGKDAGAFLLKTEKAADAEALDGIDSTGFVRGAAGLVQSARVGAAPGQIDVEVLTVPGLNATVFGSCAADGIPHLAVFNGSGTAIDMYFDDSHTVLDSHESFTIAGDSGLTVFQLGRTRLKNFQQIPMIATVTAGMHEGGPCRIEAQAVSQT